MCKATTVDLKIFGTAEPAVGIIAASIPILRAFIRRDAPAREVQFVQLSKVPGVTMYSFNQTAHSGTSESGEVHFAKSTTDV